MKLLSSWVKKLDSFQKDHNTHPLNANNHRIQADYFNLTEIENLTNLCFQSKNYIKNFPQVFQPENKNNLILYKAENKPVSFCSIYPTYFKYQGKSLLAYCIGSVCTHPDYRSQGFATKVLKNAEEIAIKNSADFLYLFSSEGNIYINLNYKCVQNEYIINFNKSHSNYIKLNQFFKKIKNTKLYTLEKTQQTQNLSLEKKILIWNFILRNFSDFEPNFSFAEFCRVLEIHNLKMYLCLKENRLTAIGFLNKGDDFLNTIHGIYYNNFDSLIYLLKKVIDEQKKNSILFHPGKHAKIFCDLFEYIKFPSLYLKVLNENRIRATELTSLCIKNDMIIGSLQGT